MRSLTSIGNLKTYPCIWGNYVPPNPLLVGGGISIKTQKYMLVFNPI